MSNILRKIKRTPAARDMTVRVRSVRRAVHHMRMNRNLAAKVGDTEAVEAMDKQLAQVDLPKRAGRGR